LLIKQNLSVQPVPTAAFCNQCGFILVKTAARQSTTIPLHSQREKYMLKREKL